jgi:hypothetical protein
MQFWWPADAVTTCKSEHSSHRSLRPYLFAGQPVWRHERDIHIIEVFSARLNPA